MATPPVFSAGSVLTAGQMNAVGMWLVKTQSLNSGATTVSITNAFSSDFDNYMIQVSNGTLSAASGIKVTMTGSATGYYGGFMEVAISGNVLTFTRNQNDTAWTNVGYGQTNYIALGFMMGDPYAAIPTRIFNAHYASTTDAGTYNGFHNVSTSYTGFTLGTTTGGVNFTGGTLRVYGLRN